MIIIDNNKISKENKPVKDAFFNSTDYGQTHKCSRRKFSSTTKNIFICQNTDLLNYKTKASFQARALETRNVPASDGQLLKVQIPDVSSSRQRGPYRSEEFLASKSQDSNLSAYTSSL